MTDTETQLSMIDGRDALLLVLVKPSRDEHVMVDAHCNGLDKMQAAKILLHVARQWKAEAESAEETK